MTPSRNAAQAAAAACRRLRGTSSPAPVPSAQRTRRIQKNIMMQCRQGRYRRAKLLLDRNRLLDLRVPENLQSMRDLHPPAPPQLLPWIVLGCRMRPGCSQMRSSPSCERRAASLWIALALCANAEEFS
jgi:hypothetical protein